MIKSPEIEVIPSFPGDFMKPKQRSSDQGDLFRSRLDQFLTLRPLSKRPVRVPGPSVLIGRSLNSVRPAPRVAGSGRARTSLTSAWFSVWYALPAEMQRSQTSASWNGRMIFSTPRRSGEAWFHYRCTGYSCSWDEEDRNDAVKLGYWKPQAEEVDRPESVWFHVPPMLSRFVAFHDIVAAYLAQLADPTASNIVNFYNDHLGLPVYCPFLSQCMPLDLHH